MDEQGLREIRTFVLQRKEDETGISGTGVVAEGVLFSTGRVVLNWVTGYSSVGVYDNLEQMIAIHGHGGKTVVEWVEDWLPLSR